MRERGSISTAHYSAAALLAFLLYLTSAIALDALNATTHFGADGHLYADLAKGIVHERMVRFHPVTVAIAFAWMESVGWLSAWIAPKLILKALFAAVGAGGVLAAIAAFACLLPRREALIGGAIYAISFGVWYFSSVEESKIVTATLAAAYIAIYLRLRENNDARLGAVLLAVFLIACLNEITSCFLAAIPAVDVLWRKGTRLREHRLLGMHILVGAGALAALELLTRFLSPSASAEGASHTSMFYYYFSKSDHGIGSFYNFVCNWLLFNIVAPSSEAKYLANAAIHSAGYFSPGLSQYLGSPFALAALAMFAVMVTLGIRRRSSADGIVAALTAYSLTRGATFFLFNPMEPLLFSPAVTLAHLLICIVPFAQGTPRWKGVLLAAAGAAMFITNAAFFIRY